MTNPFSEQLGALSVKRRWMHCWETEATRETNKDALYSSVTEKLKRTKHLLQGEGTGAALAELSAIANDAEKLANA